MVVFKYWGIEDPKIQLDKYIRIHLVDTGV